MKNQIDFDSFTFSVIDQHIAFLPFQLGKTFTNLHILVVVQSKLTALNQRGFEGLTNLKGTTIVNNNILFDDVPQLVHLNLSSNNIQTLPEMIFVKLAQLKTLNISDNRLQSFLFELLPMNNVIEEFHIKNNEPQNISLVHAKSLKKVKIINLSDNICIDLKSEKGKSDSKTITELLKHFAIVQFDVNLLSNLEAKIEKKQNTKKSFLIFDNKINNVIPSTTKNL